MKTNNPFIQINNLSKRNNGNLAIDAIHCSINLNKRVGIIGETGSGKSTLLKLIAGLYQPDEGQIFYNNRRILGPDEKLIPGDPKIAYLSQHFELRNNYQIWDILSFENLLTDDEAKELYQLCKIDHLLNRWTDELSGGEKQRIALAKLLITKPELLLLDEPFSNLDNQNKLMIHEVLNNLVIKYGISCVMVSHDTSDILSWSDELIVMQNGSIIQHDETKRVYNSPENVYVAGLLGDFQLISKNSFIYKQVIPEVSNPEKLLFVRPHYFNTHDENLSLNSIRGIVKTIHYKGFYSIIEIEIEEEVLRISTLNNDLQIGSAIYLNYNQTQFWFL